MPYGTALLALHCSPRFLAYRTAADSDPVCEQACITECECATSEVGTENASPIVDESVDSLMVEKRLSLQFLKARKKHPIRDSNHPNEDHSLWQVLRYARMKQAYKSDFASSYSRFTNTFSVREKYLLPMYGGFVTTQSYFCAKSVCLLNEWLKRSCRSLFQHAAISQHILHSLGNRRELLRHILRHTNQRPKRLTMLK